MGASRIRHPLSVRRGRQALVTTLLAALVASVALAGVVSRPAPGPVDLQDMEVLEELAANEAGKHLPPLGEHQRLSVSPANRAQQLPRCPSSVEASVAPGVQVSGRVLIELRCKSGAQWHLYVPVRVVGTTPVVVTTHAIIAGNPLTRSDLALDQRDVSGLPPGYLNSLEIALGLTASRAIAGGAVLTNQELLGARAVERGQAVTLVASNGDISVRMAGRALSDGFVNQRVRVENLSSGRIVEGVARSGQVVEIMFQ
jgi:flagella basal body P-ring formation protein FlgA